MPDCGICRMKLEEIPATFRECYVQTCDCGKTVVVRTMARVSWEYDTALYVECCACGDYVEFILPVD